MTRLLVIGASGSVGSATVRAAIDRQIPTLAFLRTPSKLSKDFRESSYLKVQAGDATSSEDIRKAVTDYDPALGSSGKISAVVIAAPFGSMRKRGATHYEEINKNVLSAVREEQMRRQKGEKIKVWIMSGQAVMDFPDGTGTRCSDLMPVEFYVEYEYLLQWLRENCQDVDWTMNCPAPIGKGEPKGPYFEGIETIPGYIKPAYLTQFLPKWRFFNLAYNWFNQQVTFNTLGIYMVDHLEADGKLQGKRVGVLEDKTAKQ